MPQRAREEAQRHFGCLGVDGLAIDSRRIVAENRLRPASLIRTGIEENVVTHTAAEDREFGAGDAGAKYFALDSMGTFWSFAPATISTGIAIFSRLVAVKAGPSAGAMAKTARMRGSR
jgi:hypothetical protein